MANSGVLPKRPSATPVPGMSVRALERADLPAVAALVGKTFRLGPRRTEPALADFLLAAIEQPDALVSRLDGDPWIDTYVDGSA